MHEAAAFGLRWRSDLALEHFAGIDPTEMPADVLVRKALAPPKPRDFIVARDGSALCRDGVRLSRSGAAVLDMFEGQLVEWWPGQNWEGRLPDYFYKSLAAIIVAWRGALPIHGSAVNIDGKAVLICGASGAGKSTLTAGLINRGARLISDDLSVLWKSTTNHGVIVYSGGALLRLHPEIANMLAVRPFVVAGRCERSGKVVVRSTQRSNLGEIPLAAVVLLDTDAPMDTSASRSALLAAQTFRPRWVHSLPCRTARAALVDVLTALPVIAIPGPRIVDRRSLDKAVSAMLNQLEAVGCRF